MAQEGPLRDQKTGKFTFSDLPLAWEFVGIYRLEFPDGRFYIGSSIKVRTRLLEHKSALVAGTHPNPRLQRGWNKFKEIKTFPILVCSKDNLIFYEQKVMNGLLPSLNLSPIAGRPNMTDETRRKISIAHKGKIKTPEHCLNLSLSQKGRPRKKHSTETKIKISLAGRGNKWAVGSKRTEGEKAKLAKLMEGNQRALGNILSQNRRSQISIELKGNKRTLGRIRPPHEREQISIKMKEIWAERRANAVV